MPKGEKKYEAVGRDVVPEVYRLIDEIVKKHHATDLAEARIGVMYVYDVPADRDERTWWGKARLISAKEREYHPHDFVIELNFDAWRALESKQQRALIDHELCHCGAEIDDAGETTYYIRKHDLEEFNEIVERHGLWRKEAEEFARRATGQVEPTLFDPAPAPAAPVTPEEEPEPSFHAELPAGDDEDDAPDPDEADWVTGDEMAALLDLDKADIQSDLDLMVNGWVANVSERTTSDGKGEDVKHVKLTAICPSRDHRCLGSVSAPDVEKLVERAVEADKAIDQKQKAKAGHPWSKRAEKDKKGAAKRERARKAGAEDRRTASAGR